VQADPMPTVLRVGPYRFFFYSGDGHGPAHIHVGHVGWEGSVAKFWLDPVRLARSGRFGRSEIREIDRLVNAQAERPLEATEDALSVEPSDGRSIWPDADEDINIASLVAGRPSHESATPLQRWLAGRKQ
jgi:hypothetical protein